MATHPDDETLGCGGSLLRFQEEKAEIHWVIVTEMLAAHGYSATEIARRELEIAAVARLYGFSGVHRLGFPAGHLDETPLSQLVGAMSKVVHQVQPTQIFLPFANDVHSDHQYAFRAAYSCTKVFRYPSVRKVMMMETLSETDFAAPLGPIFTPNLFIDISSRFEQKLAILRTYQSELHPHPFPRSEDSIRALATLRGAAAGCRFAESFMTLKEIV
jgi:LmbE family N-acetylglucosaminyl deacetylase